jgi:TonB family protein
MRSSVRSKVSRTLGRTTGVVLVLMVVMPCTAFCQSTNPRHECPIQNLKAIKTVFGTYTDEASDKNVEGTVTLCVTVDAQGKVTEVATVTGPPELIEPSIKAAKQWLFEPPAEAPATTKIQISYNLTKPCPDGKGSDVGDIVTTIDPVDGDKAGLKILDRSYQPWPPYPETARSQRLRGQLYLSIVIEPDGTVSDVRVLKALDELLDAPAVETVRTWRFKVSPNGTASTFFVTLSFRIPCLDH